MNFSEALEKVKQGKSMRLPHWKSDVIVKAQFPDENSKMTAPYLYVESRYGKVPWKETFIELFSEEWEIVDDPEAKRYYQLKHKDSGLLYSIKGEGFSEYWSPKVIKWESAKELFDFFCNLHGKEFFHYFYYWIIEECRLPPGGTAVCKAMPVCDFLDEQYNKFIESNLI